MDELNHYKPVLSIKAILEDNAPLYKKIKALYDQSVTAQNHLEKYHDFLCEIHQKFLDERTKPATNTVEPDFGAICSVSLPLSNLPMPADTELQACPYGEIFARRVAAWWEQLTWGHGHPQSFLELYFQFALSTKTLMPVRIGKGNGVWKLRDQDVQADIQPLTLSVQSAAWGRFMNWWVKAAGLPYDIQQNRGLHPFGYSIAVKGIGIRAYSPYAEKACARLWDYFQISGRVQRKLESPWCVQG